MRKRDPACVRVPPEAWTAPKITGGRLKQSLTEVYPADSYSASGRPTPASPPGRSQLAAVEARGAGPASRPPGE